jgi:hypothetical protein
MSKKIDDEKLREAKAKLACHIEPPKGSAYAEMLAKSGLASDVPVREEVSVSDASCGGASCNTSYMPAQGEKIRLTEMTSAGG